MRTRLCVVDQRPLQYSTVGGLRDKLLDYAVDHVPRVVEKGAEQQKVGREKSTRQQLERLTAAQLRQVAVKLGIQGRESELKHKISVAFGARWYLLRRALDRGKFDEWIKDLR